MASTPPVASGSNTPCAACKAQRRKCTSDCVFAPYFPPEDPQKFNYVHKVFGASNVSKILMEIRPENREDAVISMAYEAQARLRDPVYGCVGLISVLQHRLHLLQTDLQSAQTELSHYIGTSSAASSMLPYLPPLNPTLASGPLRPIPPLPPVRPHPPPPPQHIHPHYLQFPQQVQQQRQMMAGQQDVTVASAAREQEAMIRIGPEQQKFHQMAMMRPSSSSPSLPLANNINNSITNNNEFTNNPNFYDSTDLALGTFGDASYLINQQQQHQTQEFNQQIQERFFLQCQTTPHPEFQPQPQPQPLQEFQLRLGILRKLEDEGKSSSLLGHNNTYNGGDNDHGPSTY